MLIDETGFLLAPLLRRTWALRGYTPILEQQAKHRTKVSVLAALTLSPEQRVRLDFQTYPDAYIRTVEVAAFLRQLFGRLSGKVIVLCDQGSMHKGDPLWEVLGAYRKRVSMEYLPPYAPKLNPVEWLWSWLKWGQLANYAAKDVPELDQAVRDLLQAAKADPQVLLGFFAGSALPLPQQQGAVALPA